MLKFFLEQYLHLTPLLNLNKLIDPNFCPLSPQKTLFFTLRNLANYFAVRLLKILTLNIDPKNRKFYQWKQEIRNLMLSNLLCWFFGEKQTSAVLGYDSGTNSICGGTNQKETNDWFSTGRECQKIQIRKQLEIGRKCYWNDPESKLLLECLRRGEKLVEMDCWISALGIRKW